MATDGPRTIRNTHVTRSNVHDSVQRGRARCRRADDVSDLLLGRDHLGRQRPLFGFSDTWQLVINTGTTIVTFLMVFLIQNTQNRDGAAIQAKLDELIRASASQNAFIGIEHLTQAEVEEFRVKCAERAAAAGTSGVIRADEAAKAAANRAVSE